MLAIGFVLAKNPFIPPFGMVNLPLSPFLNSFVNERLRRKLQHVDLLLQVKTKRTTYREEGISEYAAPVLQRLDACALTATATETSSTYLEHTSCILSRNANVILSSEVSQIARCHSQQHD